MEIGRAAAQWAIEMDAKVGRIVESMSHENEGFDLLHRLADGEIEYIEVKGSKGPWTENGVSVSPSQIRYASKYMDKFWLYVVEYALDPERRKLWRIKIHSDRPLNLILTLDGKNCGRFRAVTDIFKSRF